MSRPTLDFWAITVRAAVVAGAEPGPVVTVHGEGDFVGIVVVFFLVSFFNISF